MYKYINLELYIFLWDTNSFAKRSSSVSSLSSMKVFVVLEVQLHSSLISTLDIAESPTAVPP